MLARLSAILTSALLLVPLAVNSLSAQEVSRTPPVEVLANSNQDLLTVPAISGAASNSELELPKFFSEATAKANPRTYYFAGQGARNRSGFDSERIAWALGGSLQVNSGKAFNLFSLGSELFTSQKLYGPKDKDGTRLLKPGQESYTVLGVLNPRIDYEEHRLTLYRQRIDQPFVNSQDNRMTPNTFEAYSYWYTGEGSVPKFEGGAGYINKIKQRNSVDFVYMSEAAGIKGSERGMPWIGGRYRPFKDFQAGAFNYVGIDFLNIFYADSDYAYKLGEELSAKSAIQFADQRSIGDDLLTGSNESVGMWGVRQQFTLRQFTLRGALTMNGSEMDLISPYGYYPGYTKAQVADFNRAGETTWRVGAEYDLAALGLDGFLLASDYFSGNGAVDQDGEPAADMDEVDVRIDYRVSQGILKGFWLRLQGGFVDEQYTPGWSQEYRVVCNYDLPLM